MELPIKAYDLHGMQKILSLVKPYQMAGKPMQDKTKRYYRLELDQNLNGLPMLTFTHINKMGDVVHCQHDIQEMRLTKTGGLKTFCTNGSRINFDYEFK